ncbi:MAG TPA: polysaccharide biosynthesis C-terminal domain-containing protein [Puia sp.]|nr:polysaccharide biosynthesis C-terminal domain-containing protein [Puia sp.]
MPLKELIFQNVFWRGLYFLSTFILNIIIARCFKADGSGVIYYVINNLSLLLLITGASLESGAAYYAAKKEISEKKIGLFCFLWALFASTISAICLFLMPKTILGPAASERAYFVVCIAYVMGFLLINYFSALLFARQNFFISNFILLSANTAIIFFIIIFDTNDFGYSNFVIIYLFSFLLQGILIMLAYFLTSNDSKFGFLAFAEVKRISRYSLIALAANIVFFLVYRVDYWFVQKFCPEVELGNYIQVSKLGQIFLLMPTILAAVIFPKTAEKPSESMQASLQSLSRLLVSTYFFVLIILIAFGKFLFPFLYGASFRHMYTPFLLLSPGILSLSTQALLAAYFAGMNKLKINLAGALISLLIIITGDLLFIPLFGINAAAAVSSIGYICYLAYSLWAFKKQHKSNLKDFFLIKYSDIDYIYKLIRN